MPGKIHLQDFITRQDLRSNPQTLFVFGDNIVRKGFGGQAKEMRGEPNAIGIPTKNFPSTIPFAYFTNFDLQNSRIRGEINQAFRILEEHLKNNGEIVFPKNGIGNGLSQLEQRAPEILKYIETKIQKLYEIVKE